MIIENVSPEYYAEMLDVWEDSVRATHDFITEEDIAFFKPIIIEHAFPAVSLKCVKNEKAAIVGFLGVHESKIEMLFIADAFRGMGIGTVLLEYAIQQLGATEVDVNEQNSRAVGVSTSILDLRSYLVHRLMKWVNPFPFCIWHFKPQFVLTKSTRISAQGE